jgi:hypothetical protein
MHLIRKGQIRGYRCLMLEGSVKFIDSTFRIGL